VNVAVGPATTRRIAANIAKLPELCYGRSNPVDRHRPKSTHKEADSV
jgi:hypothetical protein